MAVLLCCLVFAVLTENAQALPAFARKYKTSCVTCHEAFPRLNGVGEAFRLNGYKFSDDELYIKEEPVEMGDEAYKRLWPNAVWPSDIPGLPPLSVTLDNQASYDVGGTKNARSDLNFPKMAKLIGAGALGDNMSVFLELGFTRQGADSAGHHGGGATEEGTETDVEGWVQFEDLFGRENTFNIRVGTIGMHEIGLFTARSHNRFSVSNYLYTSWSMPTPMAANIADVITGDEEDEFDFEGNPFTIHAQPGIELNGFGKQWRYAVGLVNGNGDKFNDNNTEKDVYLQLAYKMGGIGFDGSGMGEGGLGSGSDPWQDDSVTLSFFGYYGTSPIEIEMEAEEGGEHGEHGEAFHSKESDRYWRAGPGILWRTGDLQLGAGYIWGKNDNPFGAVSSKSVNSETWFVEANYFAKPWLIPYARYEVLTLDLPSEVTSGHDASWGNGADQERVVVGAKMLLRANVSLGLEGIFYLKDDRAGSNDDNSMLLASLAFAF